MQFAASYAVQAPSALPKSYQPHRGRLSDFGGAIEEPPKHREQRQATADDDGDDDLEIIDYQPPTKQASPARSNNVPPVDLLDAYGIKPPNQGVEAAKPLAEGTDAKPYTHEALSQILTILAQGFGILLGGWLFIFAFTKTTGWIVRGFLGIPSGQDSQSKQ